MRRALRRRRAALRRVLLSLVTATAIALPATGAHAGEPSLSVLSIDASEAPEVTLTVAAPPELAGRRLDAANFEVRESGKLRKAGVTGVPSDPMDVVLVLDTSGSMRGAAIGSAKAAATDFLRGLPLTVPVALVGFGSQPYVLSGFTTDRGVLANAIAGLQATGETALYDAVSIGTGLFSRPGRRAVVLLSDGKDTVSARPLEQATSGLVGSRAAFYGVLLQTAEAGIPALDTLAAASGGQVVPAADPAALRSVYEGIASELSSVYELTIRTTGSGSIGFSVRVERGDITAEGSGRTVVPDTGSAGRVPATVAPPRVERAGNGGPFAQGWALAFGLAALFVGLLGGALLLLRPRKEQSQLTRRRARSGGGRITALADQASAYAEQRLERAGKAAGLNHALERAGIAMRSGELVVLMVTGAFSAFALAVLFFNLLVGLIVAAGVILSARLFVTHRATQRGRRFGDQLEQTLPLMASSLRAGFGLMQAVDAVARESESPTADEFRRVVTETRLGRDLADALHAMSERVGNEDFRWVVQAIEIHRQVGGDLAEVLDNVDATIRDRNRVRRQIDALSSEGRLSAMILMLLPVFVLVALQFLNPGYLGELTSSALGWVMVGGALTLLAIGGVWLRRITRLVF